MKPEEKAAGRARDGRPQRCVDRRVRICSTRSMIGIPCTSNVLAHRGKPMQTIVPAISSQSAGPLGLKHLPRFWLKATLEGAERGSTKAGSRAPASGFDTWFSGVTGMDLEQWLAYHSRRTAAVYGVRSVVHREREEHLTGADRRTQRDDGDSRQARSHRGGRAGDARHRRSDLQALASR